MRLNRRNVLVGLGAIVAGGGGALATGAFSTVEATRDVTIQTEGDGAALLNLSIDDSYSAVATPSGTTISFDVSGLNENAITSFDEVLTISHSETPSYEITVNADAGSGLIFYEGTGGPSDTDSNSLTTGPIDDQTAAKIGIAVDTGENTADTTITIEAIQQ
ncbi:hypothetical protein ACFQO4_07465 [Saliphagus sp. GCM10025334]